MLRRLVRSYYRLRYFPRLLTEMLTRISNQVADLHRSSDEADMIGRMMSSHEERVARVHDEIVAFCDDAIRAMMTVSASIADVDTRMQTLQHGLQRLDNASVDTQGRMAEIRQSLEHAKAQAAQDPDTQDQGEQDQAGDNQVGNGQAGPERTGQATPHSLATLAELVRSQAAQIDRIEALVAGQARSQPAHESAPKPAPAEMAFAASDGAGQSAGDDDRLSHA